MLLSRFWYVFLSVAVAAAVAAALLAQSSVNARSEEALALGLQRDRAMVDAVLRLEARSRLDRIAFITVDGKLGALLKQAAGISDPKRLEDIHAAVKGIMETHLGRMAEAAGEQASADKRREFEPDIAFALDGDGRIIAQLGPLAANPAGASLATFPLVRRALQGYVRDDVWVYDRRVYRMAARPVLSGSEYAGAIVHGYRLEKGLVDKLSASLGGATLAFFHGSEILGSHVPAEVASAPQAAELATVLPQVLKDPKFQAGQRFAPLTLQGGGRATFDKITGSAAALGVGYAVARPIKLLSSPLQLFAQASQDDVKALPLVWLGLGTFALGLIGLGFLYLERDRHLKQLMRKTGEIGSGERDRLIVTEWRGGYRALADRINQALEKSIERAGERAPATRKKANLDEILGPTPEANVAPFFAFASGGSIAPRALAKPSTKANTPKPTAPPAHSHPASTVTAALSQPSPTFSALDAAPAPSVAPPSLPPPLPSQQPPRPAAAETRARAPASAVGKSDTSDSHSDDAHWREVYDAYIATRKQCGEPVDNLNFEKFGLTLRKTRDQIIDKQGVKSVRFSVQVKEGKAALKAQPIKR